MATTEFKSSTEIDITTEHRHALGDCRPDPERGDGAYLSPCGPAHATVAQCVARVSIGDRALVSGNHRISRLRAALCAVQPVLRIAGNGGRFARVVIHNFGYRSGRG